jgi:hypothetical protein
MTRLENPTRRAVAKGVHKDDPVGVDDIKGSRTPQPRAEAT